MSVKPSEMRIDVSSLPVFFRKLRLSNPTVSVCVKPSAYEGKVVIWHEDDMVRTTLRRVIVSL